jgi:hypothetical protein
MEIFRKFYDGEFDTAYTELLKGFRVHDRMVARKGATKVILEGDSVTLIYGNDSKEMTYNSFIELIKPYNELQNLLAQKGFKKRTKMGVDIFEDKDIRILVGSPLADPDKKRVKMMLGGVKERATYNQAESIFNSYR